MTGKWPKKTRPTRFLKRENVRATKLARGVEKFLSELIVNIPQVIIENSKVKVEQFNLSCMRNTALSYSRKLQHLILSTEFNFQGLISKHLN